MSVPHRGLESKSELLFAVGLMRIRFFRAASSGDGAPDSFTAY